MDMEFESSKFKEADGVEVISLVDNSIDFLSSINQKDAYSFRQWAKTRYGEEWIRTHTELPNAEHGFSMLIHIFSQDKSSCILFDTGCSADGAIENAKRLGVNLAEIECVVLSHGHYDHFGGLLSTLKAVGRANLPLIVHEDMFKIRGTGKDAIHVYPAFPTKQELSSAQLISTKQPELFINDMLLVTGEIPRITSFEKGYIQHKALGKEGWTPDPWILDDRAIAIRVKNKGLVIVSGCAHAGIINTLCYIQKITNIKQVHAVLGGFHLAGKENETRIEQTVKELKQIKPKRIIPSHCTGWRGTFAIANALQDAFICNSVGNLYSF